MGYLEGEVFAPSEEELLSLALASRVLCAANPFERRERNALSMPVTGLLEYGGSVLERSDRFPEPANLCHGVADASEGHADTVDIASLLEYGRGVLVCRARVSRTTGTRQGDAEIVQCLCHGMPIADMPEDPYCVLVRRDRVVKTVNARQGDAEVGQRHVLQSLFHVECSSAPVP
ncbi:MAG TPA: hypothetical protein VMV92_36655 [Streptosporangiaceae bacterium]|nr:hypothetical protein [Streptosporangiaceae bacterium]HVB45061.1 hypothetical protein [Streptosporangiaceae bacterium]